MQSFRTIISLKKQPITIHHQTPVMLIGSCFANNIGNKLEDYKFRVQTNPFGVVYNPTSIYNSLNILLDKKTFTSKDLCFYNNKWISIYHYTNFSDENQDKCIKNINECLEKSYGFLRSCRFLFITFGTAMVYEYIKTGQIVSNCHKIPPKEFNQKLLTIEEIVNDYCIILNKLITEIPELQVIFTVSPVRHWKDGATCNQLSKSILNVSIHQLINKFPLNASYFPAYEIVMDDLRDYRYYNSDMLHLNQVAIDYIWEIFLQAYFEPETIKLNHQLDKIISAYHHKPVNPESKEYRQFAESILNYISELTIQYPFLDFSKEINYFSH